MSRRRWNEAHELGHDKSSHYVDDIVIVDNNGNLVAIQGKPGTGKAAFVRLIVEDRSDQIPFQFLSAPHRGSAAADNLVLNPPKVAEFLMLLLPMKYRENLVGDAEEEYWTRSLPTFGVRKARLIFWIQAIHALLIFSVRPLAGIAGIAWIGKIVDSVLSQLLR